MYATLRFLATGSTVDNRSGLSQSSVSRYVLDVVKAIALLKDEYIFMPRDREELNTNFQAFYEINPFPDVVGTVGCTHVKILGQGGEDGEVYRNRKQYFSINVQSVSRADFWFQDIVARWPGSTENSFIFNQSRLKQRFEKDEFTPGVLLGGGEYELYPYLMTPFSPRRNRLTENETYYNQAHSCVRDTVERQCGVWKRRFPCLVLGLRCRLETALIVIVASAVLHNFCIDQKDDMPLENLEIEEAVEASTMTEEGTDKIESTNNDNREAVLKRDNFAQQIAMLYN